MDEPSYTVEPVTQLALFQLGYHFLIMGPRRECWGFHRTVVEEALLVADRLNAPPPSSR
jgi:hypothetical protein